MDPEGDAIFSQNLALDRQTTFQTLKSNEVFTQKLRDYLTEKVSDEARCEPETKVQIYLDFLIQYTTFIFHYISETELEIHLACIIPECGYQGFSEFSSIERGDFTELTFHPWKYCYDQFTITDLSRDFSNELTNQYRIDAIDLFPGYMKKHFRGKVYTRYTSDLSPLTIIDYPSILYYTFELEKLYRNSEDYHIDFTSTEKTITHDEKMTITLTPKKDQVELCRSLRDTIRPFDRIYPEKGRKVEYSDVVTEHYRRPKPEYLQTVIELERHNIFIDQEVRVRLAPLLEEMGVIISSFTSIHHRKIPEEYYECGSITDYRRFKIIITCSKQDSLYQIGRRMRIFP